MFSFSIKKQRKERKCFVKAVESGQLPIISKRIVVLQPNSALEMFTTEAVINAHNTKVNKLKKYEKQCKFFMSVRKKKHSATTVEIILLGLYFLF